MLKFVYVLLGLLMFVSGLYVFVSGRKHLLVTLLRLEFIVLRIYLVLFNSLVYLGLEEYLVMLFLTLAVCEGALGLSILITIIRTHGNDYFQSLRVLQC